VTIVLSTRQPLDEALLLTPRERVVLSWILSEVVDAPGFTAEERADVSALLDACYRRLRVATADANLVSAR